MIKTRVRVAQCEYSSSVPLENLRHDIGVLPRSGRKRFTLTPLDHLLWVWLSRV
jgi:hypothetical protein